VAVIARGEGALTILRVLEQHGAMRWAALRRLAPEATGDKGGTLSNLVRKGYVAKEPAPPLRAKGRPSIRVFSITDSGRRRLQSFRRALGVPTPGNGHRAPQTTDGAQELRR
jgi:DNA-binding PadR family transcriptional regulator